MLTYQVNKEVYMSEYNLTDYKKTEVDECVQKEKSFWITFTQWYSTIVSYFIPLAVLIVTSAKILGYLSKHNRNMSKTITVGHFYNYIKIFNYTLNFCFLFLIRGALLKKEHLK